MMSSFRLAALFAALTLATPVIAADRDWKEVGQAVGKEGTVQPGGIYRVGLPRTDLNVSLDGVALKPGFRWAAGWPSNRWVMA
jgi:hypothetical protein